MIEGVEDDGSGDQWPGFGPQTALGAGPLGAAQAADREIARLYAVRARQLAAFATDRPVIGDRAQGEHGAMSPQRWALRPEILRPVSEWATQEAAIGLTRSQSRAQHLLEESRTLTTRLPATLAALEGGLLTPEHLRPLLERIAPITDPRLRAEIGADVLRWMSRRAARQTITAPAQLGDRVLRVVTRRNARDAAQKELRALSDRGVFRQHASGEGPAGLGVIGTVPEVEALHAALSACVDALPQDPADARTRGQKTLDVLCDLVLRPGADDVPPVQVALTLVAGVPTLLGGDQPAELNGAVVSAETARQLLDALTGAGLGDGALAELRDPANPTSVVEACEDITAGDGAPDAGWLADMEAALAGGVIDLALDAELVAAQDRWEAELAAGLIVDPDPPGDRPDAPPEPPPAAEASPGTGWWAAADRALGDASAARWAAEHGITRAGRLVRTAARAALADLLGRTGGGGLAERPRIALVDPLTGVLVSLTDLPGLRRDRRCRWPGCRKPVCRGEIDHRIRWPHGTTGTTDPPPL